ncbi:pilus assembly protein PilP [Zhongshania sp.]|jgi:type IV pilus assembly protein PilP|uniref:pilus assembly protein PilP n=1 Tax=Zhongshania sp. TaxID=1971902 RepID=UPI001B7BF9DC|nr:pilus assembly protein PilP [Zhongshania sp.]MBQ0795601.1 pilus assembly protein PilP [Zhongshania sp.]|tara:strand:- start:8317 stop:8844 length:528 start_codon:yes stop_codon:yes gene_type:complete
MILPRLVLVAGVSMLAACSGNNQYADLDAFVAEKRASPSGQIAPIPALKAYRAFSYSASGMRAPFNRPVDVKEIARLETASNIKPDLKREKEFLEQFSLDSITVVGTVRLEGVLWALIKDPDGGVHRVRRNNYLGRNFGKIIDVAENYLTVVEIVSTGGDGWVERPRSLELKVRK